MTLLEPLLCPCCTPAILHSLAHSNPAMLPRQLMLLGTGALTAAIAQKWPVEKLKTSELKGVK
ncbi:MAG: hypothetical protein SWJ54_13710 [Cyanobacteriota bacterium]|nr:hypothetical protein [Cyanobacteriota bacterium]